MADTSETAARGSWRKRVVQVVKALIVIVVIVFVAAVFLPVQDAHKTQRANASSAAAKLLWLNEAQQSYAAGHASGFACQLRQLRPAGPAKLDSYGYPSDENERFTSDESSGYLFAMSSCQADPSGRITQYTATAAARTWQDRILGTLHRSERCDLD
jgi:type II secretory pathway pseudopilin PulG